MRSFKYRIHQTAMSRDIIKMHMSGCYVLFKNFDATIFTHDELVNAKERLVAEVRFIINALYKKGEISQVPYYLSLLSNIKKRHLQYVIAKLLIKLLKLKSRRFTEFIIYH